MLSIKIYQVGKTKDTELQRMISDLHVRMSTARIEEKTYKSEREMFKSLPERGFFIALDSTGESMTSEQFAQLIEEKKNQGISTLVFLIGPADGFTEPLDTINLKLSLSKMTFSHQTIRLILAEQLYRAIAILEGKPFAQH